MTEFLQMFEFSQLFAPRIGHFELSASSLEYDGDPKVTALSNGLTTFTDIASSSPSNDLPFFSKPPPGQPGNKGSWARSLP